LFISPLRRLANLIGGQRNHVLSEYAGLEKHFYGLQIQFKSRRIPDYMFKVVDGQVSALTSPFHEQEERR
jgi:hypothetical protein